MSLSFQLCDSKNYGWCRVFLLKSPGTKTSPLQVWHQTTLTAQPNSTEIGWGEGDGFALHLPCCNQTWNIHANLCVLWTLNGNWVTGWFSSFLNFGTFWFHIQFLVSPVYDSVVVSGYGIQPGKHSWSTGHVWDFPDLWGHNRIDSPMADIF